MMETVYLDVLDMHCSNCPAKIEKAILKLEGVTEAKVNWNEENGFVTFNQNVTGITDIIERINKMGFKAKECQR